MEKEEINSLDQHASNRRHLVFGSADPTDRGHNPMPKTGRLWLSILDRRRRGEEVYKMMKTSSTDCQSMTRNSEEKGKSGLDGRGRGREEGC
jgi:hypothetical protein